MSDLLPAMGVFDSLAGDIGLGLRFRQRFKPYFA
jgi:hypothetical protein